MTQKLSYISLALVCLTFASCSDVDQESPTPPAAQSVSIAEGQAFSDQAGFSGGSEVRELIGGSTDRATLLEAPAAPEPDKQLYAESFINRRAPDLEVETWLTKQPDFAGKMVLVDFWATWCRPCRNAIPHLNALHRKFGDRLVVIGLSDETPEEVRAMTRPRMNYHVAVDTKGRMKKAFAVQGLPHVVLIDSAGIVRWQGLPSLPGHELTEAVVEALLDAYVR